MSLIISYVCEWLLLNIDSAISSLVATTKLTTAATIIRTTSPITPANNVRAHTVICHFRAQIKNVLPPSDFHLLFLLPKGQEVS